MVWDLSHKNYQHVPPCNSQAQNAWRFITNNVYKQKHWLWGAFTRPKLLCYVRDILKYVYKQKHLLLWGAFTRPNVCDWLYYYKLQMNWFSYENFARNTLPDFPYYVFSSPSKISRRILKYYNIESLVEYFTIFSLNFHKKINCFVICINLNSAKLSLSKLHIIAQSHSVQSGAEFDTPSLENNSKIVICSGE